MLVVDLTLERTSKEHSHCKLKACILQRRHRSRPGTTAPPLRCPGHRPQPPTPRELRASPRDIAGSAARDPFGGRPPIGSPRSSYNSPRNTMLHAAGSLPSASPESSRLHPISRAVFAGDPSVTTQTSNAEGLRCPCFELAGDKASISDLPFNPG